MLRTRVTELFQIKHPIMLAGMSWITEPEIEATYDRSIARFVEVFQKSGRKS